MNDSNYNTVYLHYFLTDDSSFQNTKSPTTITGVYASRLFFRYQSCNQC